MPDPRSAVPHRILVADDYETSAELVCELLEHLGHVACFATSGRAALDLARTFEPDIAILDLDLPDISGHTVAQSLRSDGRKVFIVALTGSDAPEDRARAHDNGFDHFVLKPPDRAKLGDIIRRAESATA